MVHNEDHKKAHAYVGLGDYEISFYFDVDSSVVVEWISAAGAASGAKVQGTDYEIVNVGADAYIRVLLSFGSGGSLMFYRDMPLTQTYNWVDGFEPAPSAIMAAIDRVVWMVQQINGKLFNSVRAPEAEELDMILPDLATRASTIMGFDAAGQPFPFAGIPTVPVSSYVAGGLTAVDEDAFHAYFGIPDAPESYPIGGIAPWPMALTPTGWLPADGSILNIVDYPDLFDVYGIQYGGNGTTTFGVPDIEGIGLVGVGTQSINGRVKGDASRNPGDKVEDEGQQIIGQIGLLGYSNAISPIRSTNTTMEDAFSVGDSLGSGYRGIERSGSNYAGAKIKFDSADSPGARTGDYTEGPAMVVTWMVKAYNVDAAAIDDANVDDRLTALEAAQYPDVPVGGIVGIHEDFGSTPAIPDSWAPCNGATISDGNSPYNGLTLPDLNSSYKGTSRRGHWLRGGTVSGLTNPSSFNKYLGSKSYGGSGGYYGAWVFNRQGLDGADSDTGTTRVNYSATAALVDNTDYPHQVASMTVLWYMRIK